MTRAGGEDGSSSLVEAKFPLGVTTARLYTLVPHKATLPLLPVDRDLRKAGSGSRHLGHLYPTGVPRPLSIGRGESRERPPGKVRRCPHVPSVCARSFSGNPYRLPCQDRHGPHISRWFDEGSVSPFVVGCADTLHLLS